MARHDAAASREPAPVGVGLRAPHLAEILATRPAIGWFEVHAENYMNGDLAMAKLEAVRRDYPISLHGVGLSLGSAEGISREHAARFAALAARIEPFLVSEHLSWSVADGVYLNDLLPLPYTEEALDIVIANIRVAQDILRRPLLVENPSSYLRFGHSTIAEADFLAEIARRTGCELLCDVNNIYVTCTNFALDPLAYLDALPADSVCEIHLAGHCRGERDSRPLLIDDHGSAVAPAVWALYRYALDRFGPTPSLVEWDKQLPDLTTLLAEARKAEVVASSMGSPHVVAR